MCPVSSNSRTPGGERREGQFGGGGCKKGSGGGGGEESWGNGESLVDIWEINDWKDGETNSQGVAMVSICVSTAHLGFSVYIYVYYTCAYIVFTDTGNSCERKS